MNLNYDIQKIEKALADIIRTANVSANVFEGQRPSLSDTMNDFIVVSVPSSINDRAAYGSCTVRIEIFVKNITATGLKNSIKFSNIFTKLNALFPIAHNTYLFDWYPTVIPLGNDGYGYHVQAVNINTTIKTI